MTATNVTAGASAHRDTPGWRVTQARVVRSEWTKLRSLRSTMWTLLVAVVLMIGLGALFTGVIANQWDSLDADERATFDPVSASLSGITFAQLAIGVLGVLLISGEYTTGMIRASLTVVPRRLPVLWGKLAVFTAVVAIVMLAASFVAFFIGQAFLSAEGLDVALGDPGVLRSVIGAALYVTVAGIICVALGTLVRNTAAGISTFVAAFFVFPPLATLLPDTISDPLTKYMPSNAGAALYGGDGPGLDDTLGPWAGFAVMCLYAAALTAAAAWRLQHTDA